MARAVGGNAEYALAHVDQALPCPDGVDMNQADGVPVIFLTAYHLLLAAVDDALVIRGHGVGAGGGIRRWDCFDPALQTVGIASYRHGVDRRQVGIGP